ncbi:MAG: Virginiamycin B lyase [Planctomycetes bacterium]|nr:Virginiamycin B lyase [Planctomycetota bacterium]
MICSGYTQAFGIACAAAFVAVSAQVWAANEVSEFQLTTEGHRPQAITPGPDGNLWVTEVIKHTILKVTPAGQITEYPIPGTGVGVIQGIAAGSDGNIWFTSREENSIRRLSPEGKFNGEFKIPSQATDGNGMVKGCWPRVIIAGPDGNLYFAEMAASKIGRITMKGEIAEYPIPTKDSKPYGLTVGADKNIWFAESGGNKIGKLDIKTGKVDEFPIPTADSFTRELSSGADGNIWFAENKGNKVGKLDIKTGKIDEYPIPTAGSQPVGVGAGPDGNIWVCLFKVGKVARVTPKGEITEIALSAADTQPFCISGGPDGNVWVALQKNRVARINVGGKASASAEGARSKGVEKDERK